MFTDKSASSWFELPDPAPRWRTTADGGEEDSAPRLPDSTTVVGLLGIEEEAGVVPLTDELDRAGPHE
ncbi:MAG: hypothetical protein LH624_18830, partial [Cryobacterium sp.]|nr:hypothetical protein [Cryobacterium sp.]